MLAGARRRLDWTRPKKTKVPVNSAPEPACAIAYYSSRFLCFVTLIACQLAQRGLQRALRLFSGVLLRPHHDLVRALAQHQIMKHRRRDAGVVPDLTHKLALA